MKIRVSHYSFHLSAPYSPGHLLGLAEAQALNALRAYEIQKRFTSRVSAAAPAGSFLSTQAHRDLQQELDGIDAAWVFRERQEDRWAMLALDTLVWQVATEVASVRLRGRGASEDEIVALARLLEPTDEVQDEARSRLAARERALAGALEDLL